MAVNEEFDYELKVLMQFDVNKPHEGIKVHHDADPNIIAATQRLFDKKLVTQTDGGYLTGLGLRAAEHLFALHSILSSESELQAAVRF